MVPPPLEQNLLVCYQAIFGITDIRPGTLAQLTKWPQFLAAHATRDPAVPRHDWHAWRPIVTLYDFMLECAYVLAAFERYNFLEQYAELFGHTPGYQQEHVEQWKAKELLGMLWEKISMRGSAVVGHKINGLIETYGTPDRELDNQIWRWLSDDPDRPPVASDSFMNTQPPWIEEHRTPEDGKENMPPEARLPALLHQLAALRD